jgi:hypothetical protein
MIDVLVIYSFNLEKNFFLKLLSFDQNNSEKSIFQIL